MPTRRYSQALGPLASPTTQAHHRHHARPPLIPAVVCVTGFAEPLSKNNHHYTCPRYKTLPSPTPLIRSLSNQGSGAHRFFALTTTTCGAVQLSTSIPPLQVMVGSSIRCLADCTNHHSPSAKLCDLGDERQTEISQSLQHNNGPRHHAPETEHNRMGIYEGGHKEVENARSRKTRIKMRWMKAQILKMRLEGCCKDITDDGGGGARNRRAVG